MSNAVRITFDAGDPDALTVRSTLDPTHTLPSHTDERMILGRDDLAVLKNERFDPCRVTLTGLDMTDGFCVVRSSRRGVWTLKPGQELKIILDGGEAVTFRSTLAQEPRHGGANLAA